MCLITFCWQPDAKQSLIVSANRDEFLHRAAQPLHQWQDIPDVYAGKYLSEGGTWLGSSKNKRFAALTNVRDMSIKAPENAETRGKLVLDFLQSALSSEDFLQELKSNANNFSLFNLLVSDGKTLAYFSNYPNTSREQDIQILSAGTYGLSNAQLDSPWPKLLSAKDKLQSWLDHSENTIESLTSLLNDQSQANDKALPETGIGLAMERILSAEHIVTPTYATRCSTGVIFEQDKCLMHEITWQHGEFLSETKINFEFNN